MFRLAIASRRISRRQLSGLAAVDKLVSQGNRAQIADAVKGLTAADLQNDPALRELQDKLATLFCAPAPSARPPQKARSTVDRGTVAGKIHAKASKSSVGLPTTEAVGAKEAEAEAETEAEAEVEAEAQATEVATATEATEAVAKAGSERAGESKIKKLEQAAAIFHKFADLGVLSPNIAEAALLSALQVHKPQRAIEFWVTYLEFKSKHRVDTSIQNKQLESRVLYLALAAYCVTQKDTFPSASVAKRLVPVNFFNSIPMSLFLATLSQIPNDSRMAARRGLRLLKYSEIDWSKPNIPERIATMRHSQIPLFYEAAVHSGVKLPEAVWAAFIKSFAERRMITRAFEIWNDFVQSGTPEGPLVWASLMRAGSLMRENGFAVFSGLWEKWLATNLKSDPEIWAVRFLALNRDNRYDQVFEELETLRKTEPGLINTVVLNNALESHLARNDLKSAEKLLHQAKSYDPPVLPNHVTYNALIRTAMNIGNEEVAQKYLDEMVSKGFKPDTVMYTAVLGHLLRKSQQLNADMSGPIRALLAEMAANKVEPNQRFLAMLADGLAKTCRNVDFARGVYSMLTQKGVSFNIQTYGALIDGELNYGSFERAQNYFRLMKKANLPRAASNYNQMMVGAIQHNRLGFASALLKQMNKGTHQIRPNLYTFMSIISSWPPLALQAPSAARRLVDEALVCLESDVSVQLDFPLATRLLDLARAGIPVSHDLLNRAQTAVKESHTRPSARRARQH